MLEGIRVLDLSSVGPASRASRWLADYGAKVIKIAPVPKDGGVQIEPPFHSYGAHRYMRRLCIDMKSDAGREAFLRLAETAQVIIESFRPGVVETLGIGYRVIEARNPTVVYCSTSGYGQNGPHAQYAGHDLNYLAVGGFLATTHPRADGGPPVPGATVADSAGGGMHAALAICAALVSGEGAYLDVAAADGVVALMSLSIDEYLATGVEPGPRQSLLTGKYACYDTYRCADDKWVAVAAIEPKFYANLCRELDCEQWTGYQMDDSVQDQVRADFAVAFASKTRDEWTDRLAPADTCVSPVLSISEVVEHPQFLARRMFIEAQHETQGTFLQTGGPLAGQSNPTPTIDATYGKTYIQDFNRSHTHLLRDAGYTDEEITALVDQGAIA